MDKISRIVLIALLLALTVSLFCGCIKIEDSHYENADASLINDSASDEAVSLMNYLKSIYGKYVVYKRVRGLRTPAIQSRRE